MAALCISLIHVNFVNSEMWIVLARNTHSQLQR